MGALGFGGKHRDRTRSTYVLGFNGIIKGNNGWSFGICFIMRVDSKGRRGDGCVWMLDVRRYDNEYPGGGIWMRMGMEMGI